MEKILKIIALVVGLVMGATIQATASTPTEEKPVAVLRALDKITARVEEIQVSVDRPFKFGALVLNVKSCRATPPEETPESAAFLDIGEIQPDGTQRLKKVFTGWMFASSPALSAMEHPVYDLWLIGCRTSSTK